MSKIIKRNLDVYYFLRYSIIEFPGITERDLRQLVYDEFGYNRFAKKTFEVQLLTRSALSVESERV